MIRRERTVREVDHVVEAAPPWGAFISDISKAMLRAEREYREVHGLPADVALSDDALAFFPGDDEILIRFTIKQDVPR